MDTDEAIIPPSDCEAEDKLLGSLLVNPEHFGQAAAGLEPADFYRPANALLFKRLRGLWEDWGTTGINCDALHETLKLNKSSDGTTELDHVGGWPAISDRLIMALRPETIPFHIAHLRNLRIKRDALKGQYLIQRYASNGKMPEEVIEAMTTQAQDLTRLLPGEKPADSAKLCDEVIEEIFKRASGESTAIPTGLSDLDALIGGWMPGNLIILAGRPGMFKTATALNFCHRSKRPTRCLFLSFEMTRKELTARLFSQIGEIPGELIKQGTVGKYERDRMEFAKQVILDRGIEILDDNDKLNGLQQIEAVLLKLKSEGKLPELVIVDYLQLISGTKYRETNRNLEVEENSRGFKAMAKRFGITFIVLSQLSRAVEARQNKRPMLSDLRDSGAIEQDGDIVIFTYRDAYYNPETKEPNCLELIVAKNRHGAAGTVYTRLNPSTGNIVDADSKFWKPDYGTTPQFVPKKKRGGSTFAANTQQQEEE